MKVYIELVVLLNIFYDALILLSTSIILRRKIMFLRLLISIIIGTISLLTIIISINKILLIFIKLLVSVLMVYVSFGKNKIINSLFYFYIVTIILGGCQYLIGNNIYNVGIVSLFSVIILCIYINSLKKYRLLYTKIHDVIIVDKNNIIKVNGYLDTGNTLIEPISKKPVILLNKKYINDYDRFFLVPFNTLNNKGILTCIKVDKVIVNNKIIDCLIGLSDEYIFNDSVDVILNEEMRELIC